MQSFGANTFLSMLLVLTVTEFLNNRRPTAYLYRLYAQVSRADSPLNISQTELDKPQSKQL